ncbi:MAG: hypothetical protein PHF00_09085 [Elusimicrobia bacterium]|nr:hypothetical protein [Elusimicrobiota bacterium]
MILRLAPAIMAAGLIFIPSALPAQEAPEAGQEQVEAPPAPKRQTKRKKKEYDYSKSKYKVYRALTGKEPRTYRFDENGNPIPPADKKKKTVKKNKKAPRPDDEIDGVAPLDGENASGAEAGAAGGTEN